MTLLERELSELMAENRMLKKIVEIKDEEIIRLREEKDRLIDYLTVNYIITPKTIKVNMPTDEVNLILKEESNGKEVL